MAVRCLRVEDGGETKKTVLAPEQELWVSLSPSSGGPVAWPAVHAPSLCCMKRGPSPAATGGRGLDLWRGVLDGCAAHGSYLQEDLTVGSLQIRSGLKTGYPSCFGGVCSMSLFVLVVGDGKEQGGAVQHRLDPMQQSPLG